jgi:hypothetical protein
MNAVNSVLGEGWNEQEVTEDEAVRMFHRAMEGMRIRGRTGNPAQTGYYTLPELVTRKTGYCFEIAQFGFWFLSHFKINSITAQADLTASISHEVVKYGEEILDYSGSGKRYHIPLNRWQIVNPMNDIAAYYEALIEASKLNPEESIGPRERAIAYNKYSIPAAALLMYEYRRAGNYSAAIVLGEFIITNINIAEINLTNQPTAINANDNLKDILKMLISAYYAENNFSGFNKIKDLINLYYAKDKVMQTYLNHY